MVASASLMPRTTSIREIDEYEGLQAKTHRGDRRHHGVRHADMWGVGAAHAEERDTLGDSVLNAYNALNGNGMRFEKVSHPQAGLRAADGVVDYIGNGMITEADKGQGDRGQSYSYAAASHGDWVYIGTMYGGLGVQAILSHGMASNMGMSAEAAKTSCRRCMRATCIWASPTAKAPAACCSSSM